ncbi:MAG: hypothetical protein V7752_01685 [Halopseudomonas sp.]
MDSQRIKAQRYSDAVKLTLAISGFSLAAAVAYIGWELNQYRHDIPNMLAQIEQTSERIDPLVSEVAGVLQQVPSIMEEVARVREQIPPILEEIAQTRAMIPAILAESGQIRQQVPVIMDEVAATREQIPAVLKSVDHMSGSVRLVASEIEATRPLVPQVLEQVELTRDAIPPMLSRGEQMIAQAQSAGHDASKGAVTGMLSGIVAAPFSLFGSLGRSLGLSSTEQELLSEYDLTLLKANTLTLLEQDELDRSVSWDNPEKQHRGEVTLKGRQVIDGRQCRDLLMTFYDKERLVITKDVQLCLQDDGSWTPS